MSSKGPFIVPEFAKPKQFGDLPVGRYTVIEQALHSALTRAKPVGRWLVYKSQDGRKRGADSSPSLDGAFNSP